MISDDIPPVINPSSRLLYLHPHLPPPPPLYFEHTHVENTDNEICTRRRQLSQEINVSHLKRARKWNLHNSPSGSLQIKFASIYSRCARTQKSHPPQKFVWLKFQKSGALLHPLGRIVLYGSSEIWSFAELKYLGRWRWKGLTPHFSNNWIVPAKTEIGGGFSFLVGKQEGKSIY